MRSFEFEAVTPTESLYHVTLTKYVPSIKKKGLVPLIKGTNWVRRGGGAYQEPYIFAFENENDALRWAARWDWSLTQDMGSGTVSVVKFKPIPDWEIDDADPLSQAGANGRWLKIQRIVPAQNIESIMVFDKKNMKKLKPL